MRNCGLISSLPVSSMSNLAASLADWLRKCCGRTRLETAADAGLAAAHTRGTGDQLLVGGHNPSLVDDSETPAVALGGTITFLQELESRVTARAFRPRWRPHQGHLFFQLISCRYEQGSLPPLWKQLPRSRLALAMEDANQW